MNATFVQRGEAVDFVPFRDIESGEVLSFGALLGIVKIPVKAGENGALHLSGIYDILKLPESIPAGTRVFWNASSQRATAEATGNAFLGVAAANAPLSASRVRIILNFGHPDSVGGDAPDCIQWQTIP